MYKNNPNLGITIVTTINGEKEYRRNCKLIKGEFYVRGIDCIQVEDKWYRVIVDGKPSTLILFDYEKEQWILRKNAGNVVRGIVAFKNGEPVEGYFSENLYNNVQVETSKFGRRKALNERILSTDCFEDLKSGVYYVKKEVGESSYRKMIQIGSSVDYHTKGYNIEDNHVEFQQKIKLYNEYPTEISRDARFLAKYLGDTTFGCEIELSKGFIPNNFQNKNGIVMCRDGSITGGEVVTIPLGGAKGLQTLKNIVEGLKNRTESDIHCSVHLHLGTIPRDRTYLCALYMLNMQIQDELFTMFPYYKTDPFGHKKKNYCQKLKRLNIHYLKDKTKDNFQDYIKDVYTKIFVFLSDGMQPDQSTNRTVLKHPIQQKWQRNSRYYHCNLQNMIFSERFTAEFRIHEGTLNSQKIINWLFICQAIVKYAEHNQTSIFEGKPVTMEDVLNYYAKTFKDVRSKKLSAYLIAYFKERQAIFAADLKKGDVLSLDFDKKDKTYVFEYNGIKELF